MPRTGLTAQEMRTKAIDAALGRMRRHGFDKVRLADVAKDLGVSHTALYPHFDDKAALFDAVTERWIHETERVLAQVCRSGRSPAAKIEEWFLTLYWIKRDRVARDPELFRAFDVAAGTRRPVFLNYRTRTREQLAGLIREAGGGLSDGEVQRCAALFIEGMVAFYHPKLLIEHCGEDRRPLAKAILSALLRGSGLADGNTPAAC